jgi:hypothetical protein
LTLFFQQLTVQSKLQGGDGMPVANTIGEQILEAVVVGPDGANRPFTVTGAANVQILTSGDTDDPVTPTWTFLVGPTLKHTQFYRAIASASVASQGTLNSFSVRTAPT